MDDWKELINDFLDEAFSLLESLEVSLLDLEKDLTETSGIDVVFRVAHTIKGGAGSVGFDDVTKLTHIMEDVLDLVRMGKYSFNNEDITLLLEVKDELYTLLKAHEQGNTHPFEKADSLIKALEIIKNTAIGKNTAAPANNTPQKSVVVDDEADMPLAMDSLPLAARFSLTNELVFSLQESLNEGEALLFIEIHLDENYDLKEVAPFEVLNIINSLAEPIIMNPSPESLDEEYMPFLNVVIASDEDPSYIQNKLSLDEVTTKVIVTPLTAELFAEIEQSMGGALTDDFDTNTVEKIEPVPQAINKEVTNTLAQKSTPEPVAEDKEKQDTPPASNKPEEKRSPTLKVESSRIDELLNLLGELVIIRSGLNQFGSDLEKSVYNTKLNLGTFFSSAALLPLHEDPETNRTKNEQFKSDFSVLDTSMDHYIEYIQQLSRISSTLQTRMMNLRMIPVQNVFSRFTRLARDIAKNINKKVELVIEGGETEIDKGMIEDLYDPLMHMIRNSLDHGIELPEDRIAAGKNEVGTVQLKAYQEGDAIYIEITDDGKGIDAEKIVEKAISKGFITESQASSMSSSEKLALIFLPGFSTAEEVSNLSGRGVGMDVVHRNIQELGGSALVFSTVGLGSTIRIQLPLTLAIIQGLVIMIKEVHYIIPITSVEETIILSPSILLKLDNYYAIKFREKLIPLISLSKVLYNIDSFKANKIDLSLDLDPDIDTDPSQNIEELEHVFCIIVRFGTRQVGIIVPEILKEQDIVVKPLEHRLITSPGISAATIVGNGEIGFILDLPQIIQYAFKNQK